MANGQPQRISGLPKDLPILSPLAPIDCNQSANVVTLSTKRPKNAEVCLMFRWRFYCVLYSKSYDSNYEDKDEDMRKLLLAVSMLLGSFITGRSAEAVLFSGSTATSSPTTIDTFLTYTSASFSNVDVPVGAGPTSLSNLGTFTLNVCGSVNCVENFGPQDGITDFTLRITFSDPAVSGSPAAFTADIFGTISRSGNSNNIGNGSLLTIDFVNTAQHFNYSNALGSGGFDISVNDPAPYTADSQFGHTRTVTGQITNLTFDPAAATTAVPEPVSALLLVAGLIALRIVRHKRDSSLAG